MVSLTLEEQVVWRELATDLGFNTAEVEDALDGFKVNAPAVLANFELRGLVRNEDGYFSIKDEYENLK